MQSKQPKQQSTIPKYLSWSVLLVVLLLSSNKLSEHYKNITESVLGSQPLTVKLCLNKQCFKLNVSLTLENPVGPFKNQ